MVIYVFRESDMGDFDNSNIREIIFNINFWHFTLSVYWQLILTWRISSWLPSWVININHRGRRRLSFMPLVNNGIL